MFKALISKNQNPFKKSIQKTILSDKDREGIAESNNIVNKERFVQLNKRDTKSLSIFEFFFSVGLDGGRNKSFQGKQRSIPSG